MDFKEAIEAEYKIIWDYYKKSIDERVELFTWYFRIVTLPAVLFGLASFFKVSTQTHLPADHLYFLVGLIFGIIFLAGVALYITYTLMCNNVMVLETRIRNMRAYFVKNADAEDKKIFFPEGEKKKNKPRKWIAWLTMFLGVKFWRAIIIPIVNSATFVGSVSLLDYWNGSPLWPYLFSFLVHIFLFGLLVKKNGELVP